MKSRAVTPTSIPAVSLEMIRDAAAGLQGVATRTPLVEIRALTELAGVPVRLKLENQQPTGAFKLRGAWTAIRRLSAAQRDRGVITYSSGNHGQAVAFAAHKMGIRSVIVMPETVRAAQLEGVRKWEGEVVFAGTTSEDRLEKAQEIVAREGLTVIPPFDHPDIISGQATVGLEILSDFPEVRHVVVPVGGGGLCAGICAAVSLLRSDVSVTAVEPEGAAAYAAAIESGHPVRLEQCVSVADGLLPLSVGATTFEHMVGVASPVSVTEEAIIEATQWLLHKADVVAEPSGAATTAALRSAAFRPEGPTVLVVSGGNIRPETIDTLTPAS